MTIEQQPRIPQPEERKDHGPELLQHEQGQQLLWRVQVDIQGPAKEQHEDAQVGRAQHLLQDVALTDVIVGQRLNVDQSGSGRFQSQPDVARRISLRNAEVEVQRWVFIFAQGVKVSSTTRCARDIQRIKQFDFIQVRGLDTQDVPPR